jgi:hypothetical protein
VGKAGGPPHFKHISRACLRSAAAASAVCPAGKLHPADDGKRLVALGPQLRCSCFRCFRAFRCRSRHFCPLLRCSCCRLRLKACGL